MSCINDSDENMELRVKKLSHKINSKYKSGVANILSINDNNLYILTLSLPKSVLEVGDVWSIVSVYQWTKHTIMPNHTAKHLRPSAEKKIMLNWLLPKLQNRCIEVNVFPQEEALRVDHGPKFLCVAREIEFQLETISPNPLLKSLVKVMIVRKVDRDVVNFKHYLQKLVQQFVRKNAEHECFCVVHIMPSDGIHMLEDVLPSRTKQASGLNIKVFSAFNPNDVPVSCVVLYTANSELSEDTDSGDQQLEKSVASLYKEETSNLYLDVDATPTYL